MPDKTIKCVECGKEFVFTEREQAFYAEKGFQEPKRCKECRMKAKARREKKVSETKVEETKAEETKVEETKVEETAVEKTDEEK